MLTSNIIRFLIGSVVLALGVLGFWLIEDTGKKSEENGKFFANLIYGFRPSVIKENSRL